MSVAAVETRPEVAAVPDDIESPRAKLVYLYLATSGRATVDELADSLGMQKMALFSVLGTLDACDVVALDGDGYRLA